MFNLPYYYYLYLSRVFIYITIGNISNAILIDINLIISPFILFSRLGFAHIETKCRTDETTQTRQLRTLDTLRNMRMRTQDTRGNMRTLEGQGNMHTRYRKHMREIRKCTGIMTMFTSREVTKNQMRKFRKFCKKHLTKQRRQRLE